jgi:DNA-binding SARP family transcriptional activator
MDIKVLGTIGLMIGEREVRLSGQRQRALLAALVLAQGKVVSIERLIDVLWDTKPPATARVKVHCQVSRLRQVISDEAGTSSSPVLTQHPGYVLQPDDVSTDLREFETLSDRGRHACASGEAASGSVSFARALGLWRGPAFAGVEAPAIRSAAQALDERRLMTIEEKAQADLDSGNCYLVAAELPVWLAEHPHRERMRGLLMMALYQLGCRADALALYRQGRQLMRAELGLEFGPSLRLLHQRILGDDPVLSRPG